jgi:hypothetical protein
LEYSVDQGTSPPGYLAPEQFRKIAGVSTRHAAVDSFGLGMCLFFIIAGRDPYPAEHRHKEWQNDVYKAASSLNCSEWKSLPKRFARLILNSTRDKQSERWDMGQIQGELQRINEALMESNKVQSAELIAEEIIARTTFINNYTWDSNKLAAIIDLPSGINISMTGDESQRKIVFQVAWINKGYIEKRKIQKWLPKAALDIENKLRSSGWIIENVSNDKHSLNIIALNKIEYFGIKLNKAVDLVQNFCTCLSFE